MQARDNFGGYGEPIPYNKDKMESLLDGDDIDCVEVFRATEKELTRRTELFNKTKKAKQRKRNKNARKSRKRT